MGSVGEGAKAGFGGCFGALAAVLLLGVGLLVMSTISGDADYRAHTRTTTIDYSSAAVSPPLPAAMQGKIGAFCEAALVSARRRASGLSRFSYVSRQQEPRGTDATEPQRATCFYSTISHDDMLLVAFDVSCASASATCVHVVSIGSNGRGVIFVDRHALDEAVRSAAH